MIIIHHNKHTSLTKNIAKSLLRWQTKQKKIYTGRIRLWIEIPISKRKKLKFVNNIMNVLAGLCYKDIKQVREFLIKKIPDKNGISILVQDMDEYSSSYAGYDKLQNYISVPNITMIQEINKLNEQERNKWRKIKRNESALTQNISTKVDNNFTL